MHKFRVQALEEILDEMDLGSSPQRIRRPTCAILVYRAHRRLLTVEKMRVNPMGILNIYTPMGIAIGTSVRRGIGGWQSCVGAGSQSIQALTGGPGRACDFNCALQRTVDTCMHIVSRLVSSSCFTTQVHTHSRALRVSPRSGNPS